MDGRDGMTGIPANCTVCGVRLLNPHELTGLCRECKLIRRNERLSAELVAYRANTDETTHFSEQASYAIEGEQVSRSLGTMDTEE